MPKPEYLKFFTPEQRDAFLEAAKEMGDPAYSLFTLQAHTGLRIGETVRLQAKDVEERDQKMFLHVPTLKSGQEGTVERGKRPGLVLTIPIISKETMRLLQKLANKSKAPGWLFPSRRGLHMSIQQAGLIFKTVLLRAGLDSRYSTHALRHTMGYGLWKATKDIVLVQRILRHRSWASSMRYTHLTLDDLEKELTRHEADLYGSSHAKNYAVRKRLDNGAN